jgi:hypothetical protein
VTLLDFEGAIPEEDQEQPGEPKEAATKDTPLMSYRSVRIIARPLF